MTYKGLHLNIYLDLTCDYYNFESGGLSNGYNAYPAERQKPMKFCSQQGFQLGSWDSEVNGQQLDYKSSQLKQPLSILLTPNIFKKYLTFILLFDFKFKLILDYDLSWLFLAANL